MEYHCGQADIRDLLLVCGESGNVTVDFGKRSMDLEDLPYLSARPRFLRYITERATKVVTVLIEYDRVEGVPPVVVQEGFWIDRLEVYAKSGWAQEWMGGPSWLEYTCEVCWEYTNDLDGKPWVEERRQELGLSEDTNVVPVDAAKSVV
jgi:hypothetical protein